MSKRFTKLPQICHGSATNRHDGFADEKTAQRIGLKTVFNPQNLCVSVCSRSIADTAMFLEMFIPAEASRMKAMLQGHPGSI